jgi:hypothetical protein
MPTLNAKDYGFGFSTTHKQVKEVLIIEVVF